MMRGSKIAAAALGLVMVGALATTASASTPWQRAHPRRAEVNARLAHQNGRIGHERRDGEISGVQAHELRTQDRGVRAEERFDASRDGGHITRAEQRTLNRQENAVSREIGH